MSAGVFSAVAIATLTLLGIGARYLVHGDLNAVHGLFSLFFSTNLLICYWEACLYLRRDYIEKRAVYWRERRRETGRTPAVEFLTTRVPLTGMLSPAVWADAWATYSMVDESYADRRTFGFTVDIANGFFTPVPTLVLYGAFTVGLLPAVATGILAAMLFWQWVVRVVALLGQFLRRREAGAHHEGRVPRLRRRPERLLGAVPRVRTVRLRSPDPGRQLQRAGILTDAGILTGVMQRDSGRSSSRRPLSGRRTKAGTRWDASESP